MKKIAMALSAVSVVAMTAVVAFAAEGDVYTPVITLGGVNLMSLLEEIKALIPALLPVTVGLLAFRKGWSFLMGALRGA